MKDVLGEHREVKVMLERVRQGYPTVLTREVVSDSFLAAFNSAKGKYSIHSNGDSKAGRGSRARILTRFLPERVHRLTQALRYSDSQRRQLLQFTNFFGGRCLCENQPHFYQATNLTNTANEKAPSRLRFCAAIRSRQFNRFSGSHFALGISRG